MADSSVRVHGFADTLCVYAWVLQYHATLLGNFQRHSAALTCSLAIDQLANSYLSRASLLRLVINLRTVFILCCTISSTHYAIAMFDRST